MSDTTEIMKYLSDSERKIVTRLVDVVLATGYTISVHDGEAFPVKRSSDRATILAGIGSTDVDTLVLRGAGTGDLIGNVLLVYGNEPGVVISDHSDNLTINTVLAPVFEYAKGFEQ